MSMCYSVAEGYGVYLNRLKQYLNGKNIINEYKKDLPESLIGEFTNNISESKTIRELNDVLEYFLYNAKTRDAYYFFPGICQLICDKSGNLLEYFETDYNDIVIFLPRYYPWELTEDYPKTKEEVIKLFAENLSLVYDVDEEIIKSVIDKDVFEVTCS